MIGQTLDKRYKIIRKLGSGGFGEAFLAKDISLHGIFCVVKQLKPIDKSEQVLKIARRLFVTESETLLRLGKHDQIPALLAHLEKGKDFFLVQEFVDGHPLSAEINANQPWAVDEVVDLLASTLEPLAFAHANNVIHRDIKPDNLMRRHSDGKVVLIDFGAVKEVINSSSIAQGQTVFTVGIGTPGYMPVEQAHGNPKFSSDIYALGVTCIQSLTGLSIENLDTTSWRHLASVDANLADILDRMVQYDYRHRYTSGSEALEAVREYMKDKPRTSPKVSYLPSPELVNNYSYTAATVSTRKISIATKVSNTLNLSETLVSKIFLWFELSFTYIVIALVFAVFSLTCILGTVLLFTPKLLHEPNLWVAFIISIILSILYFYFVYKFQGKYKKSSTVSLLKIAYEDLFQTLLFTSSIVGYYILDHNRVNANFVVQIGLCVIYLPSAYIECIRASPHTSQFRSFPYDWKKVDKIVCPTRILGLIISIFLGLGFVVKSKDIFNSGFELYISAFISSVVMMISYGMILSIIHAIAIDTNVDRSKWFK